MVFCYVSLAYSQVNLKVDNSGMLYVSKSSYVVVSNSGNLNIDANGTLIMDSDSDEFSSLYVDGSSTGTAEYRRWVASVATRDLVSAPVTGEAFNSFYLRNSADIPLGTQGPGGDLLFGPYDNGDAFGFYYESLPTDTYTLDPGQGYRAAAGTTLSFIGDVNTGNVPVDINKGSGKYAYASLIGNPYTTYISASGLITAIAGSGALNNSYVAIYGYDGSATSNGSTWNAINSLNSSGLNIAPGQGFMVYSDNDGGSITFTKAMQTIVNGIDDFIAGRSADSGKKSATEERYNFKLKIENASDKSFSTDLYFLGSHGTRGLDVSWDAGAFQLPSLSIATQLAEDSDGTAFQIQCLPIKDLSSNDLMVPVYVKASAGVEYTISMDASTLPTGSEIYLQDIELNTVTLLEDTYTFTTTESLNGAGRFYLTTSSQVLNTEQALISGINIISVLNTKQIMINGLIKEPATLSLIDLSGRKVMQQNLETSNNNQYIDVKYIKTGIYIVKLKLKDSGYVITKKVLIK